MHPIILEHIIWRKAGDSRMKISIIRSCEGKVIDEERGLRQEGKVSFRVRKPRKGGRELNECEILGVDLGV